jgi:hypothetical protein
MSSYEQINAEYVDEAVDGVKKEIENTFSHPKSYDFKVVRGAGKSKYMFSILSVFFGSVLSAVAVTALCQANMGMISGMNDILNLFRNFFK